MSELHYPAIACPDIFHEGIAEVLASLCTPLAEARDGDILAIIQDWRLSTPLLPMPISSFVVMDQGVPTETNFRDLPPEQKSRAAIAAMEAQDTANGGLQSTQVLFSHLRRMEPGDGEAFYVSLYSTADVAAVVVDNYADEVFDGRYDGEPRSQEVLEDAFALLVNRSDSHHGAISAIPGLANMAAILNHLAPVHDDDGEPLVLCAGFAPPSA